MMASSERRLDPSTEECITETTPTPTAEAYPDPDRHLTLHHFFLETGRTVQRPPILWAELRQQFPEQYKRRPDPEELMLARVPQRSIDRPRPKPRKLKPLTKEEEEHVRRMEDYMSLKDLVGGTKNSGTGSCNGNSSLKN